MRRDQPLLTVAGALLAALGAARAQTPPKGKGGGSAAAAVPAQRVVLVPLTSLTEAAGKLAPLEGLVLQGLGGLPGVAVVSPAEVRAAVKKAKRPELEACAGEVPCLVELGKLLGVTRLVAGEVGGIGTGQVVYLKVVDVPSARETSSTTAVFEEGEADKKAEARAAAYRLLAPQKYLGSLSLKVDVPGATVFLDGRKVASSPVPPLTIAVGTHALRVTHEQYRDWVRFVDVKFGEATTLPVPLTAYPVISDEMRGRRERHPTGPLSPLPWYRKWYTVAGVAGGIFLTALIVSYATAERVNADAEITVEGLRGIGP